MARHGVSYETVKQTALKLLSQGEAPSVQRIRDSLGTGSNTTIAEHLKIWRENYAKQNVHTLPAQMPKEIIPAMESLWQVAVEQAREQLSTIKSDLEAERVTLQVEKVAVEQLTKGYQSQLEKLGHELQLQSDDNQKLHTELAVAHERLKHREDEIDLLKYQYETHKKVILNEKEQAEEGVRQLQKTIDELSVEKKRLAERRQTELECERQRQEQSEARWAKLVDEARQERLVQEKGFQKERKVMKEKIEKLQLDHSELQCLKASLTATLSQTQKVNQNLESQLVESQRAFQKLQKALKKRKQIV